MNRLHRRIEQATGVQFGVHQRAVDSAPEFTGAFYVRLGRTKADLVPVEVGLGSRFFWMSWGQR
jgi:hypothetical protein